jgi:pyrrolidone-carboxylate peptidase
MNQTATRRQSTTTTTIETSESVDPGRYICNYTYFYSMVKFQSHGEHSQTPFHTLFLHVPPYSVASPKEQLEAVVRLMEIIYQTLLESDQIVV